MEPVTNKKNEDFFSGRIAAKEKRKLKAQRTSSGSAWSGLGMFGMVGWSVAIPTLLGAGLGIWLDKITPQSFSWVLTCLLAGLVGGCIIAGYWIAKEEKDTHQDKEESNE